MGDRGNSGTMVKETKGDKKMDNTRYRPKRKFKIFSIRENHNRKSKIYKWEPMFNLNYPYHPLLIIQICLQLLILTILQGFSLDMDPNLGLETHTACILLKCIISHHRTCMCLHHRDSILFLISTSIKCLHRFRMVQVRWSSQLLSLWLNRSPSIIEWIIYIWSKIDQCHSKENLLDMNTNSQCRKWAETTNIIHIINRNRLCSLKDTSKLDRTLGSQWTSDKNPNRDNAHETEKTTTIMITQIKKKSFHKKALINRGAIMNQPTKKGKTTNTLPPKLRGGVSSSIKRHNNKNWK